MFNSLHNVFFLFEQQTESNVRDSTIISTDHEMASITVGHRSVQSIAWIYTFIRLIENVTTKAESMRNERQNHLC